MYICGDIHRPKIIHQNWGFLFLLPRIILSTITIESNWNVWHPLPTFIGRVLKLLFYKKSQNLPQLWLLVMMFKLKKQVNFKELSKRNFIEETNHRSVNYISINYTIVVDRVPEIQSSVRFLKAQPKRDIFIKNKPPSLVYFMSDRKSDFGCLICHSLKL